MRSILAAALLVLAAPALAAGPTVQYEVTITNLTVAQQFTPILAVAHKDEISLFESGAAASPELAALAEAGDLAPMTALLGTVPELVGGSAINEGLLDPGASATIVVETRRGFSRLSVASMLIPTNDTFMAVDSVRLPRFGESVTYALAYDAGSEPNDQSCANMPGPRCGGEGLSPDPDPGDEGIVVISNGFHDLGTVDADGAEVLGPRRYDWRNPVARVTISRIRH